ncbi:hypothetical protein [Baaleninema simplex]|uniref:hypothetical protein n=1 Tax=Baaleninema simplex TaxID=2862350 RepID=UPI00037E9D3D|nr:hypothetical protein [Baaleninema simplex]
MPIAIPDKYKPGLIQIGSISTSEMDSLVSALNSIGERSLDLGAIAREVFEKAASGLSERVVLDIISSLFSLKAFIEYGGYDIEEILVDLTLNLELEENQKEVFKDRIQEFLEIPEISFFLKANLLTQEYEKIYSSSRILTDIRPVFEKDDFKSVIVVHSLRIQYSSQEGSKEFFVALDGSDLQELQEQIQRASKKSRLIEDKLKELGTSCINSNIDKDPD